MELYNDNIKKECLKNLIIDFVFERYLNLNEQIEKEFVEFVKQKNINSSLVDTLMAHYATETLHESLSRFFEEEKNRIEQNRQRALLKRRIEQNRQRALQKQREHSKRKRRQEAPLQLKEDFPELAEEDFETLDALEAAAAAVSKDESPQEGESPQDVESIQEGAKKMRLDEA
ncbi:LdOrf-12 peptide [Lymantria dispar multiple nucleopolyhedrovirus]|uniref:LdOrf-12 peptide n=1 Tax=Lymantria dispar multicapsid nuclear polyhedrosis virus TaxID=10449 RepID=Q9YMW2_NPVLD|nr:LdOrf-12 peptide [Lymantria dispar multiple nucleopolyhedrovirus]AAC70197.1 LdOrf-12 peptide [Lymantria dispar multiple nucleopolyhedrovirus]